MNARTRRSEWRGAGQNAAEVVVELGWMSEEEFDEATSPEAICRLGSPCHKPATQRGAMQKETLP